MPNRFALIETEPMVELRGRKESASTAFRSVALFWFAGSLFFALPLEAREDGLQSLQLPPMSVESEPAPEMGFELPPPAYPLQPVDQLPSQGARHGLVNTTKGNLVFRVTDLRLGGRMPIEFARVYDSSSASPPLMTVPPVSLPKWAEDLGSNWITSYSAYLLPVFLQDPNSPPPFVAVGVTLPNGVLMATPDGDRLYWVEGADGVFRPWRDVPSRHMKLVRETTTRIVETQLDGTRWTYSLQPGAVSQYVLTRIQDRSGNAIILTYQNSYLFRIENTDGAWIEIRRPMFDTGSPSGGVQSFPPSRIVEIMDSTNRSVHFSYTLDALGRLTAAADALGNPWTYGYDSSGRLVSANDPLNNTYLTASYDATGRIQSYEANAGVWSFEYPAASNITRATDALGNTWQYTRSGSTGITTRIQEPTGGAHQFTLDSANNPVRYVGPEGESATWTYDAKHRMTAVQPPGSNGSSITYSYDSSAGWVNSMTALDGGVTTFARDSSGRVIQETDPMNGWWTSTYSGLGDRLTLRLPNGNAAGGNGYQWSFTYDGLGNVVTAKDPLNREFHLEYTAQGDLRTMKRPDVSRLDPSTGTVHPFPVEWRYERDVLGRITSTTDPEGRTWTHTYDAAGRLVHVAGPATNLRYGYDDRSRLAEVVVETDGSNGPRTAFTYDAGGRLVSKVLPGGGSWTYAYDGASRLVGVTDPVGRSWTYARDLSGRVIRATYPGDRQINFVRDAAGRLIERHFPDVPPAVPRGRSETFAYDVAGRLTRAQATESPDLADSEQWDWTGNIEWSYDLLGRPTRVLTQVGTIAMGIGREITFQYDANGNRTRLVDTFGQAWVTYQYDQLDRLTQAESADFGSWAVTYDPVTGDRTRVVSGAKSEEWDYDLSGRVIGHRTQQGDQVTNVSFTLDAEGRSVSELDQATGLTKAVLYGTNGLVERKTEYDGTATTTTDFTYNVDGNLAQSVATTGTGKPLMTRFDWDAAGRLISAAREKLLRTYTWQDAPPGDDAAVRLWRAPNNVTERTLVIDFGYDGRLRKIVGLSAAMPATLLGKYRWSPLRGDLVLERKEASEDRQHPIDFRRMTLDVADYYSEEGPSGGIDRIMGPIAATDALAAALRGLPGRSPLDVAGPFKIGLWSARATPTQPETFGSIGSLTGLGASRSLIDEIVSQEQRIPVTVANTAPVRRSGSSFYDEWLEDALAGVGLGARRTLPLVGSRGTSKPAGNSSRPEECDGYFCSGPDDRDAVKVCFLGPVSFAQESGPGGRPGCVYLNSRMFAPAAIPPGWDPCAVTQELFRDPDPFRYPDISEGGVSLTNGDFIESVTDLEVFDAHGAIPFTRTYRSGQDRFGMLGWKWLTTWEERLYISQGACTQRVWWSGPHGESLAFFRPLGEAEFIAPPESTYELRIEDGLPETYTLRHVSGAVRTFDSLGFLTDVSEKGRTLHLTWGYMCSSSNSYECWRRLISLTSSAGAKLEFSYQDSPPFLLGSITGDGTTVRYDYTQSNCFELESVKQPDLTLGYDRQGQPLTAVRTPETRYAYANPQSRCDDYGGVEKHMLTGISVLQYDPINDAAPAALKHVLGIRYIHSPLGAADHNYMKVEAQCFAKTTCNGGATDDDDLEYQYTTADSTDVNGNPVQGWKPSTTTIIDRRVVGTGIRELHNYNGNDTLTRLVQDEGGLEKTTTFEYDPQTGMRTRTTRPDGSCDARSYVRVAGSWLVEEERLMAKSKCHGASGPDDLVTRYTYDDVTGKVRSVTRPEAFPGGIVPTVFDYAVAKINDNSQGKPFRLYTTFYDYDLHQGPTPGALSAECARWGLTCPRAGSDYDEVLGDINFDISDDSHWYGNLVRVRWAEVDTAGAEHERSETFVSQPGGRPIRKTDLYGVTTTYDYYDYPAPSAQFNPLWDWRRGDGALPANLGPLATITLSPRNTAEEPALPDLVQRFAWSSSNQLIAKKDETGVIEERTYDGPSQKVLEERITAPQGSSPNLLRITRTTHDLRGREVRRAAYDGSGNLITSTWTAHDEFGRPTAVTVDPVDGVHANPLNLVSKTFYDQRGRVVKTVTPKGRVTCSTYDNLNRASSVTKHAAFDGENDVCQTSDASQDLTVSTVYDAMDRPWRTKDGNGNYVYNWYDPLGRLAFKSSGKPTGALDPVILPLGVVVDGPPPPTNPWYEETTYGLNSLPTRKRFFGQSLPSGDGYLQVSWIEYDNVRRAIKSSVAQTSGLVPWTIANQAEAPADGAGGVGIATTKTWHDGLGGKVSSQMDAGGRTTDFQYDAFGREKLVLAPLSQGHRDQISFSYNAKGQQERVKRTFYDPTGVSHDEEEVRTFDPWSRISMTDGAPNSEQLISTFEYDALDHVTGSAARWSSTGPYTQNGNPVYDPNDRVRKVVYDAAGRVTKVRDRSLVGPPEVWAETSYGYDKDGLTTSLMDAQGNTTNWTYDGVGLVREMNYPPDSPTDQTRRQTVRITQYDLAGNPLLIEHLKDTSGAPSVVWTNEYGQYDTTYRLTRRTADTSHAGTLEFFGTTEQRFRYDDLGRMVTATDRVGPPDQPDQDVVVDLTYGTGGRLLEEDQQQGADPYRHHLITSRYERDGFRFYLGYPWSFDSNGQELDRYTLTMGEDTLGRLGDIVGPVSPEEPTSPLSTRDVGELAQYTYAGNKVWMRSHQNGTAMQFFTGNMTPLYDGLGRVTGIRTLDTAQNVTISDFHYGYDRVGNRNYEQRRHEPENSGNPNVLVYNTRAYDTDLLGRLEKWREGSLDANAVQPTEPNPSSRPGSQSAGEEWLLDLVGNWTEKRTGVGSTQGDRYTPNSLNQYTTVVPGGSGPASTFSYDFLGQLRENQVANQKFVWDGFGRLTQIKNRATGSLIAQYRYDALNRRVEKLDFTINAPTGQKTRYFYDGWRAIEERTVDAQETVRARYGFGLGLDEVIWMDRDEAPTDGSIESRYFLHQDALGSVIVATNLQRNGAAIDVKERYTYNSYGGVTVWHGDWMPGSGYPTLVGSTSQIRLPYLYTGQRLDAESGLYYYKNRYYDSASGRFLRRDPLGYSAGPSLYQYAKSNPAFWSDQLGLDIRAMAEADFFAQYGVQQDRTFGAFLAAVGSRFRKEYTDKEYEEDSRARVSDDDNTKLNWDSGSHSLVSKDQGDDPTPEHSSMIGERVDATGEFVHLYHLDMGEAIRQYSSIFEGHRQGQVKPLVGLASIGNMLHPDYANFTVNVGVAIFGISFGLTKNRAGHTYVSIGGNVGKAATIVSGSGVYGWTNTLHEVSDESLQGFNSGLFVNVTGGSGGVGGETWSPGAGLSATEIGVGTLQVGLGFGWSFDVTSFFGP